MAGVLTAIGALVSAPSNVLWIPLPPIGESLFGGTPGGVTSETLPNVLEIPPVAPPPLIDGIVPSTDLDPDNLFPVPPFDANGCPILSPTDVTALSILPYTAFGDVRAQTAPLPPLPEGYDVMPLAQGSGILTETEDMFRFRAISTSDNVAVSFFGRVQRPSGYILPFNFTLNTSTANTTFTTVQQCGRGLVLGCAASVPIGSITTGAVNAVGEIGRVAGGTFTPHTLLFSGQLDDLYPLTIDGGGLPPVQGRPTFGNSASAGGVTPPKAITITPATGKRLRVTRVGATVTSSAVAGDRTPTVALINGGVSIFTTGFAGSVQASCITALYAAMGGTGGIPYSGAFPNGISLTAALPETLYFYSAVAVNIGLDNAKLGDQVSDMFVRWEES
jgi:hypothetical protein